MQHNQIQGYKPSTRVQSGWASLGKHQRRAESPSGCQAAKRGLFGSLTLDFICLRSQVACSTGTRIPLQEPLRPLSFYASISDVPVLASTLIMLDKVSRSMIGCAVYKPWMLIIEPSVTERPGKLRLEIPLPNANRGGGFIEQERLYPGYTARW